jgi:phenylacetate-coenzyme A ligase PaaK-like adenylate-forming protein
MKRAPETRRSYASTVRYPPAYPGRCGDALDTALRSAEAYRSWRDLDPGPESSVFERYAAMPALAKRDLRAFGPRGFVPGGRSIEEALSAGEIEIVATSGSTGDRVENVWHQPWWDASEAASWRLNAHARAAAAGDHREAILTSPWCAGVPCEDDYLSRERRTLGRFLYLSERSDPSTWSDRLMDRMIAELDAFEPVVIEANPSFLARLARHIARGGRGVRSPALIVLTYENPSILHYRAIARAFDAPVASSYGSTETGYVFMECEAGRLHQVAGSCHVDFLPFAAEHGGPETGRVLVTTFDNPWRSLVRFDVGDVVRIDGGGACPCGNREGLALRSIEGRTVNLTLSPEGRAVTQGAVDRAVGDAPGLAEYQVEQTGPAAYLARIAVEDGEPRIAEEFVREALRALYGSSAAVAVERVDAIAPDPPGKYRLARAAEPVDADSLLDPRYAPPSTEEAFDE